MAAFGLPSSNHSIDGMKFWTTSNLVRSTAGLDAESDAGVFLERGEEGRQIVQIRVAFVAQHPHQAFGSFVDAFAQGFKPDRRQYVIADEFLGRGDVVLDDALNCLRQQLGPKLGSRLARSSVISDTGRKCLILISLVW